MGAFAAQAATGGREILQGIANWRLWTRLAAQEVRRRYRRTLIGPLWATLSIGLFISAMGVTWAKLWGQDPRTYLPFVCSGMLVWTLVLTTITEGCGVFVAATGLISQLRVPYSLLVCVVIWRNMLIFFHSLVVFVAIAIYARIPLNASMLLAIPAMGILFLNLAWMLILLGLLCARYRDCQQFVLSLMQIGLFITPIFWSPAQLGGDGGWLVRGNLLYHLIDVVRAPMLGSAPAPHTFAFLAGATVFGWAVTLPLYAQYHRRLPYWL